MRYHRKRVLVMSFWIVLCDEICILFQRLLPTAGPNQMVIAKTPALFTSDTFIQRLAESLPEVKLLMVVKNPITRIVSHVMHEFTNPGTFHFGQQMPPIDDIISGEHYLSLNHHEGRKIHGSPKLNDLKATSLVHFRGKGCFNTC